jgi:hypothetical protein
MTIKYKFPIPIIDELLDELHGENFFTKLDLHSRYHQIRIFESHYVFMVMSFGLTNAPSTYQSLMDSIFKPILRKLVFVFFDDILMYIKYSWEENVQHVDIILQLLEEKQIYANPSKCSFGVQEVEYLGNIVSHEGLKVDLNKIKAMSE